MYFERLYQRLGPRYLWPYIGAIAVLALVGGVCMALAAAPFVHGSNGELLGFLAVTEAGLIVGSIVSTLFWLRAARPLQDWLRQGRPPAQAAEVWRGVVSLPRLVMYVTYPVGLVAVGLPAAVYAWTVLDHPPSEAALGLLVVAAVGVYASLFAYFAFELYLWPVLRDLARRAPEGVELAAPTSRIRRKLAAALVLSSGGAGTLLAWGTSVDSGSPGELGVAVALTAVLTLSTTLVASLLVTDSIAGPVGDLLQATRRLSSGDMRARVPLVSDDELGVLGRSFNQMAEDLQRSRGELVTAREEERRRLRRDLHDGLGPALAVVAMRLEGVAELIGSDPAAARDLVLELSGETSEAIADIRRVVYGLRPPQLDELGLVGAIEERVARVTKERMNGDAHGIDVTVESPDELPPLPAAVEVAAYRIVQEALANVVVHSGASRCTISMESDAGLRLQVRDDGSGLPAAHTPGVGLNSMRERAAELGGSLEISAADGGGTLVRAHLPA